MIQFNIILMYSNQPTEPSQQASKQPTKLNWTNQPTKYMKSFFSLILPQLLMKFPPLY